MTYLVESNDTPSNLERYRNILAKKLAGISWWKIDVSTIKLGIHNVTGTEFKSIINGNSGMSY